MIPVFVTYYGRRQMLDVCLEQLRYRHFRDIVIVDNTNTLRLTSNPIEAAHWGVLAHPYWYKVLATGNQHKHYAAWKLGLVPKDGPYIVTEEDIALDCPNDVGDQLLAALEDNPDMPKIGLTIRTDVPPECEQRWAMSLIPERASNQGPTHGNPPVRDFTVDTHFAIHRAGTIEWPGITGGRLAEPYTCKHLPWYNPEPTEEEVAYYRRCGDEWNRWHVGAPMDGMLPR